jgi:shikimate dehydrogenase
LVDKKSKLHLKTKAKMKMNKDTKVCISISSNPSNTGTTLHNACYQAQGLDFVYKSFRVTDLDGAIAGVRALGIRGCSVSMPFKQQVIPLLDGLDPIARRVGAVNTVLNDKGHLIGYNTDVLGAKKTIRSLGLNTGGKVLILGAGGMARALSVAFQELGFDEIKVSSRTLSRAMNVAEELAIGSLEWDKVSNTPADILVNATPIGMPGYIDGTTFTAKNVSNSTAVVDSVISQKHTALIHEAVNHKKLVLCGMDLTKAQMAEQYQIYTGFRPPLNIIDKVIG